VGLGAGLDILEKNKLFVLLGREEVSSVVQSLLM
jgi:hypothetical protein